MAMTEKRKVTEALQRAALFGLIEPFALAVKLDWPQEDFLLEGKYGTWRSIPGSLMLNLKHIDCGELHISSSGYWNWTYSNTTARPTYGYHRTSAGRQYERLMQSTAGPLPDDLFSRT